ncbi:uncharacterized protein imd isoform X2 [Chelonus insularis]|uniref:uncharacterized protein imd isoform X2 n=1 Tax=Chelonus insularis TaxID=460826 RepID=UPI00158E362A|nr:uncharacterized protein LOC118070380 isoform X2 [Chelonus insularis]
MMLTSDAKPDPPRTRINDTHSILKTYLDVKYIPKNTQEMNSHISFINDASFTETQKNSIPRRKIPSLKIGNSASTASEDSIQIINQSKDSKYHSNSMNFNIVNCNGVKIGTTKKYICYFNQFNKNFRNINDKSGVLRTNDPRQMPNIIKKWSTSKHKLTIEDMYVIKTHIGYSWREIFSALGYSEGQLDQFTENYKSRGIGEVSNLSNTP